MIARLRFNIKEDEFLDLTFKEFFTLLELYNEDVLNKTKVVYESMRLQTYFLWSLQVAKKYQKDFKQFCKHYMPFDWDYKPKLTKEEIERRQNIDWEALEKQHNQIIGGKNISDTALTELEGL